MLFKFKWWRCRHGYRIENNPRSFLTTSIEPAEPVGFIVPNSDSWEEFRPLDAPAPYKAFARLGEKVHKMDRALVDLANAYGSMLKPRAKREPTEHVMYYSIGLRNLVAKIDAADWDWIKNWLDDEAGRTNKRGQPVPGVGRLGTAFDVQDGRPRYRLTPPTLYEALLSQALFDAAHGIEHRPCKSPECDRYFPISGPDAHRKDALYCSDACRLRHVYLKKKEGAR